MIIGGTDLDNDHLTMGGTDLDNDDLTMGGTDLDIAIQSDEKCSSL